MIVVAGGSGVLGRQVVRDLKADGRRVRVLVRDGTRARQVLGEGVEVVEVDVRRREGLFGALEGAAVVVSAVHGLLGGRGAGPHEVDGLGNANLTAAADVVGASVVLMSVIGASADSPAELCRAKHDAEQALRDSQVPWSIVRAGAFIETWVEVLRDSAQRSGRPLVLGRGERRIPFVSVRDVSSVLLRAATDPTQRGRVLEIGGEPVSLCELAEAVQSADGRTGPPRLLPRTILWLTATLARPFSPAFARMSRMALVMDTCDLGLGDPDLRVRLALPPARTVQDVLG